MKPIGPHAAEARAGRRLLAMIALAAIAGLILGVGMGRAQAAPSPAIPPVESVLAS
jgi:hypothetical protein